ncbi:MAG: hypothetical protein AB7S38_36215 [Vulcanimicrobiota bacterium]
MFVNGYQQNVTLPQLRQKGAEVSERLAEGSVPSDSVEILGDNPALAGHHHQRWMQTLERLAPHPQATFDEIHQSARARISNTGLTCGLLGIASAVGGLGLGVAGLLHMLNVAPSGVGQFAANNPLAVTGLAVVAPTLLSKLASRLTQDTHQADRYMFDLTKQILADRS